LRYVSICCSSLSIQVLIILETIGMEITGPRSANSMCDVLCMSGMLWTNLPTVITLVPSDFHNFGPLADTKQAVTRHQTLHTNCHSVRIQAFGTRCDKCLNIGCGYMKVWCVLSATMCHVYTKVSRTYLASKCLSPHFLYSVVVLSLC
jgi:hypothetical protein